LKRAINAINELKLCYDPATGLDEIVEASTGSGQFVLFFWIFFKRKSFAWGKLVPLKSDAFPNPPWDIL
jgi:hypothetical protein